MPKFKAQNGDVIEVSEQRANEVFRRQPQWIEVFDTEKPKVESIQRKAGRPKKVG